MIQKPCPWHADSVNQAGRLEIIYCEVGPAGHDGTHVGEMSRAEYLRRFRAWRYSETRQLRERNGSTSAAS